MGDFVKKIQQIAHGLSAVPDKQASRTTTVITSVSTLHYFWEEELRELLKNIYQIMLHLLPKILVNN